MLPAGLVLLLGAADSTSSSNASSSSSSAAMARVLVLAVRGSGGRRVRVCHCMHISLHCWRHATSCKICALAGLSKSFLSFEQQQHCLVVELQSNVGQYI
jgi:hypothetical protein